MSVSLETLAAGLADGDLVPYLGPGALAGAVDPQTGEPIPADGDSLILAMNNGQPVSPRLMWDFSRAAMNVELKRGRGAIHRFLNTTYAERTWTRSPLHGRLAHIQYITELMGGFAIPSFVKTLRTGKQYVCLGLRFLRDTERMVFSDMTYGSGAPTGWALIPEPTDKERRFCDKRGIEILQADISDLLAVSSTPEPTAA
ncbi:hypothetical protein [Allochromatium tepidum]|uniref:Uncharacterized protein n=1 Tax=Allochromatium tepidum TaxID=553982 RepID=A0ABM7QI96_9GAMM|nr:hypothetical protein [Allochromatium tepidum]BCU05487.1 hypothetical protein Atep_01640 [Allochromatium tepidum]